MLIVLALFTLLTMAKPAGINDRQRLALLGTLFFATLLFAIFPVVASLRHRSLAAAPDQNVRNIISYLARLLENRPNFAAKKRLDQRYSEVYHRSTKLQYPRSIPPEQQQIKNLISALRKSGLFGAAAGAIDGLNLVMLPQQSTIFVPTDAAFQSVNVADTMELFQYHVAIQRFAFAQLFSLNEGDILPTLLDGNSILVTSNQLMNFTLDDVRVISPDLYYDSTIVVHGIGGILNYSLYGKGQTNTARRSPPPEAAPSDMISTRSPNSTSDPSSGQSQTGMPVTTPSREGAGGDTSAGTYQSQFVVRLAVEPISEVVKTCLFCGAALFFGYSFLTF